MTSSLSSLETKLKIKFKNLDLLEQALVHRSYLNENPDFHLDHNERLEFLGDAVLELVVTEYLYRNYPNPEGEMTNWRAALVNANMLSSIAGRLNLNEHLLLSKGESRDEGRARRYILADTLEAVIGSIYLDQGYKEVSGFIERKVLKELPQILKKKLFRDSKSLFQEEAQERVGITPDYEVIREWGPDHSKKFLVGIYLNKELIAQGEGVSKQEAQTKAADNALKTKSWN